MSKYQMTEKATQSLKDALTSKETFCEVLSLFNLKERQIKNIISDNAINGLLTRVAVVEYVKEKTGMPESKILKEVK